MDKTYKSIDDFFKEYFPKSYIVAKVDEESSLQYCIDKSSEQFNKAIREIIKGNNPILRNKKSVRASAH